MCVTKNHTTDKNNIFTVCRHVLLETNSHLNVVMSLQVSAQHKNSVYIEVPPKCKLIKDQSYSVHCPVAHRIQPPVSILS